MYWLECRVGAQGRRQRAGDTVQKGMELVCNHEIMRKVLGEETDPVHEGRASDRRERRRKRPRGWCCSLSSTTEQAAVGEVRKPARGQTGLVSSVETAQ